MKSNFLEKKALFLFSVLLFVLDLLYPATFTYDSGHYFSYLEILRNNLTFDNWDPVRGPTFPLYLFIVQTIFGNNLNALLIVMSLLHVLFFLLCIHILSYFASPIFSNRLVLYTTVFLFIGIDPLIIGYFHAVLTEHIAVFFSFLSLYISFRFYITTIKKGRIQLKYYVLISLLTVLAWHLKQPYAGVVYFPLIIVNFIILFKISEIPKKWSVTFWGNSIIIFSLIASIITWDRILPEIGSAANQKRKSSAFIERSITISFSNWERSPSEFFDELTANYLALSNIYFFDQDNKKIIRTVSFSRGSELRTIGYRIYEYNGSNMAIPMEYQFDKYINHYSSQYLPPQYLNEFLRAFLGKPLFIFSFFHLISPVIFILALVIELLRKQRSNRLILISICFGTAFLNALGHAFLYNPVDRYLFVGYPFLLVGSILIIERFIYWISKAAIWGKERFKLERS